uniref:Ig-like domain-containing protein n=1 Tax=Panagrolaimus superbus TaxID=310955 RepID=A0A914YHU1_9BILA
MSKPTIDNSRNSPEAHVIQGRPFTFHCPVNGYPVPKISWLKDHKIVAVEKHSDLRLIDNGQGLEILSTQPIHKGLWTCQAENDAGDSEINVRLDVWTGPKASVRAGKDGVTRPLGTSVTLFCDTTGNPTPIVTWTFEDRVLLHSPNGTQISEGNKRLDIPVLKLEDSGNYTCKFFLVHKSTVN